MEGGPQEEIKSDKADINTVDDEQEFQGLETVELT